MQILSIRGENLASLADKFEIDLASDPLSSAGIFAITGETGAGKSTLLDAMCLALYGECPRLSGEGVNDDVPDAAGDTIKARDPRAILRRGASHGWAEVDFIGNDAVRYRSGWVARRARGKADGRLQNVERALTRLDDAKVLESQISAVKERIIALTGLTYDEFRRTVLLAQGDFDAFLRAGTPERAALLEKVTGTAIYRNISRQVFERHTDATTVCAHLQAKRDATPVLDDAARADLLGEQAALGGRLHSVKRHLADLQRSLTQHQALTRAKAQLAEAQTQLTEATATQQAAAPDRIRLTNLNRALLLAPDLRQLRKAEAALSDLTTKEQQAALALKETTANADLAAIQQATTAQAAAEAERLFKSFGPIWTKAEGLDAEIRAARAEHQTSQTTLSAATKDTAEKQQTLKALENDRSQLEADIKSASAAMDKTPNAGLFAQNWDRYTKLIDRRAALGRDKVEASEQARAATTEITKAEARLASLTEAEATGQQAQGALKGAIAAAANDLKQIEAEDPHEHLTWITTGRALVETMHRAARDFGTATAERARLTQQADQAATELQLAQKAEAKAKTDITHASAVIDALTAPADRATAAASDIAAQLRRHLTEGEACPVCGALEHPIHADAALAALAQELRAKLEAGQTALAAATTRATQAARAADTAQLRIDQTQHAFGTNDTLIAEARQVFDAALNEAQTAELADLPATPDTAADALAAIDATLRTKAQAASAKVTHARALRQELEDKRAELGLLSQQEKDRKTLQTRLLAALSDQRSARALADQQRENIIQQIDALDTEMSPALAALHLSPLDFDTDQDATRTRIADAVEQWRGLIQQHNAAEEGLKALTPRISAAEAHLKGAQQAQTLAQTAVEQRAADLLALSENRSELLDGEATDAHRSRHNTARLDAANRKEAAAKVWADLDAQRSVGRERVATLGQRKDAAQADRQKASDDLNRKLAQVPMTFDALEAFVQQGQPEAERLTDKLRLIDQAVTAAQSTFQARTRDHEATLAEGTPEGTIDSLEAARAEAEDDQTALQQRQGSLTAQINADDATRAGLHDLDAKIAKAGETRDTWTAVNDAIGSRSGGKFAQVAQGVTLSLLVERANLHLADLKPRYHLARGGSDLALHIVDRDMGDEVRSTRSLSGGERFLISLALALALSQMGSRGGLAPTLFIDEGFGSLDTETLDIAIDALEVLQAQGRTIGVISHVDAMKDRIPVQVRVQRMGAGRSEIVVN